MGFPSKYACIKLQYAAHIPVNKHPPQKFQYDKPGQIVNM